MRGLRISDIKSRYFEHLVIEHTEELEINMSMVCQVTGKRPMSGNNVSHANNKTRRRFLPNLHKRRFWVESEKRYITLTVSTNGMRTIDKKGIDVILEEIRSRGEKV